MSLAGVGENTHRKRNGSQLGYERHDFSVQSENVAGGKQEFAGVWTGVRLVGESVDKLVAGNFSGFVFNVQSRNKNDVANLRNRNSSQSRDLLATRFVVEPGENVSQIKVDKFDCWFHGLTCLVIWRRRRGIILDVELKKICNFKLRISNLKFEINAYPKNRNLPLKE